MKANRERGKNIYMYIRQAYVYIISTSEVL